jgi:hypothetical protein
MSMPHPRVLMIPFGCVIQLVVVRSVATVKIYTDIKSLASTYPGLKPYATIIPNEDDLPSGSYYANTKPPPVFAQDSLRIIQPWVAMKLSTASGAVAQKLTDPDEFQAPMLENYLYFLAPATGRGKKRKPILKRKKIAKKLKAAKR